MKTKRNRYSLLLTVFALSLAMVTLGFLIRDARAELVYGNGGTVELDMASVDVRISEDVETLKDGEGLFGGDRIFDEPIDPGYMYDEMIGADNTGTIDSYVRVIVKKYWVDKESGEKILALDPAMIRFQYEGHTSSGDRIKADYNTGDWFLHEAESTPEQSVYYYRHLLPAGESSMALFTEVGTDGRIADEYEMKTSEDGKTVTAVYDYDGAAFCIDIEAQSVQAEHGEEAIRAAWGVTDITVSGGELTME